MADDWDAQLRATDERRAAAQAAQAAALAQLPEESVIVAHYERLAWLAAQTLAERGRPFDRPPRNAPRRGLLRKPEPGWDLSYSLSIWLTVSGNWGWVKGRPPSGDFLSKTLRPYSRESYRLDGDGNLLIRQSARDSGPYWTRVDSIFVSSAA